MSLARGRGLIFNTETTRRDVGAERSEMGQPVVHFEVVGKDGEKLKAYYAEMFDWKIVSDNPMNYGLIEAAEGSVGPGIAGGIGQGPEGYEGHVTFYVEVPDVESALQKAEQLGGTRVMGPETIMEGITLGQFLDPEGNVVGLTQASS
jgi:predicted enzyme related to lactoylglutathione lyase